MTSFENKAKNATRRHRDETAIKKQVKIAKQHGLDFNNTVIKEPHRLVKRHVMDCGKPKCMLCGNRRHNKALKTKEKLTNQERKMFQDIDSPNDKHSNGLPPAEE